MTKMYVCPKCGKEFPERPFDFMFVDEGRICNDCDKQWRDESKAAFEDRKKNNQAE